MYIRTLPVTQFQHLMQHLFAPTQRDPFDTAYHFDVHLHNEHYRLRLYLLGNCRFITVQAVRLHNDVTQCKLITDPTTLSMLTEVLFLQCSLAFPKE